MEVLQESPSRKRNRRLVGNTSIDCLSADLNNCALQNDGVDRSDNAVCNGHNKTQTAIADPSLDYAIRDEYEKVKEQLFDQKGKLIAEKEKIDEKKLTCKDKINDLFAQLEEILKEKKVALLEKVDIEFKSNHRRLSDLINVIEGHSADLESAESSGVPLENSALSSIKSGIRLRNNMALGIKELSINQDVINTVEALEICDFEESYPADDSGTDPESASAPERVPVRQRNRSYRGRVSVRTNLLSEDCEEEMDTPTNDIECLPLSHHGSVDSSNESRRDVGEAAEGGVEESHPTPSAPLETSATVDNPPPYWQAIGLDRPDSAPAPELSSPTIPSYEDLDYSGTRLPENILELWHSFPIRRQYDRRTPIPAALLWNGNRICLADRANQKLKFFLPNGQLITEMFLAGNEIYDVAFLEECNNEARYLVTCPRTKTFFIISLNEFGQGNIVKKFYSPYQYGCVCRGTVDQTLIGGDSNDRMGSATVDVFNFSGQVIKSFKYTPSNIGLQYPRALEVHGSLIIVMDWKLHRVVVYCHNGDVIGEYSGTAVSQLVNAQDITLDHCGNILILDGETSNIHVIDLDCNPIEIIKIPKSFSDRTTAKLLSFDVISKRLAVARSNGDIAIFEFQNGYDGLPQRRMGFQPLNVGQVMPPRMPEVLPLVEGMLPSTIENIVCRPSRNRSRQSQFHL